MNNIVENFDFNELGIDNSMQKELVTKMLDKSMLDKLIRWCVQHIHPCDAVDQVIFEWKFDNDGLPKYINISTQNSTDDYYIVGEDVEHIPCPLYFESDWHKGKIEKYSMPGGLTYDVYTKNMKIGLNLEGTNLETLDGIDNKEFYELTISSKMKNLDSLKDLKIDTLIIQDNDYLYDLTNIPELSFRLYLINNRNLMTMKGLRTDIPYVMVTNKNGVYKKFDKETEFLKHYTIFGELKRPDQELLEIKTQIKKNKTLIFSNIDKKDTLDESVKFDNIKINVNHDEIVQKAYEYRITEDFEKFNEQFTNFLKDEYTISVYKIYNTRIAHGLYNYFNDSKPYSQSKPFLCIELDENDEIIVWFHTLPYIEKWQCGFERHYAPASDLYQRHPLDLMKILATIQKMHENCSIIKLNSLDIDESRGLIVNIKNDNKQLIDIFKNYRIPFLDESSWYSEANYMLPDLYYKFGSKNIPEQFLNVNEDINFNEVNNTEDLLGVVYADLIKLDFNKLNTLLLDLFKKEYSDQHVHIQHDEHVEHGEYYYRNIGAYGDIFLECKLNNDDEVMIHFKNIPYIKKWISDKEHTYCCAASKECRWPIDIMKVLKTFANIKKQCPTLVYNEFYVSGVKGEPDCNITKSNKKLLYLFKRYNVPMLHPGSFDGAYEERLIPDIYFKFKIKDNPYARRFSLYYTMYEDLNFDEVHALQEDIIDNIRQSIDPKKLYDDFAEKFVEFLNKNNTIGGLTVFEKVISWSSGHYNIMLKGGYGKTTNVCELSFAEKDRAMYFRFYHVPEIKRWFVSKDHGWHNEGGTNKYIDFIKMLKDLDKLKYEIYGGPVMVYASISISDNDNKMFVNIENKEDFEALNTICINYSIPRIKHKNIIINKDLITDKFNHKILCKILKVDNQYVYESFNFNAVKDEPDAATIVFEKIQKIHLLETIYKKITHIFDDIITRDYHYCAYSPNNNAMCITIREEYDGINYDDHVGKNDNILPFEQHQKNCITLIFKGLLTKNAVKIDKIILPRSVVASYTNIYRILKPLSLLSKIYKINEIFLSNQDSFWDNSEAGDLTLDFDGEDSKVWYESLNYLKKPVDDHFFDNIGKITSSVPTKLAVRNIIFRGNTPDDSLAAFDKFVQVFDKNCFTLIPGANLGLSDLHHSGYDISDKTLKMLTNRMNHFHNKKSNKITEDLDFNNIINTDLAKEVFNKNAIISMYDAIYEKIKKCFGYTVYYFYSIKENTMYISRYKWLHKLNKDEYENDEGPYITANLKRFSAKNVFKSATMLGDDSLYSIDAIFELNDFTKEDYVRIKNAYFIMYVSEPILYKALLRAIEISGVYKIELLYMCYYCTQSYIRFWGPEYVGRMHGELPVMNNNIGIIKANKPFNLDINYLEFSGKSEDEALNKFRLFIEMFDKQCYDIRLREYKDVILKVQGKTIELPVPQAEQIIANYYNIDKTP